MSAKQSRNSTQGVTMTNLSQVDPNDATTQESNDEQQEVPQKLGRVSISNMDAATLGELRGFTLWLAQYGSREGLRTIGDVVTAALNGEGDLPTWRQRYNNGERFAHSSMVPPGRK